MSEDRSMSTLELDLEAALRDLGSRLAAPGGAGIAARVRTRIEVERPRRAAIPWWLTILGPARGTGRSPDRPRRFRRSLLLAAAALLLLAAAVTAAIGYGLPGIRILFGPSPSIPASPSVPASEAPGAGLGLGARLTLEEAREAVDFEIALPDADRIGPPDALYLSGGRLTLAWGTDPALPGTTRDGLGLLIVELQATVDEALIEKLIQAGTDVEPVDVDGAPGYWIEGERHFLIYTAPDGTRIEDTLREVGNSLLWTRNGVTYRLEGELTMDAAIVLAGTMR